MHHGCWDPQAQQHSGEWWAGWGAGAVGGAWDWGKMGIGSSPRGSGDSC